MKKIKIIEAGNELGLGGTEYTIQLISKFLNKENFEVTVLGIKEGGARVKLIQDLGINVVVLNGDLTRFAALLQGADVFHWHGDGSLNPAVFNIVKANKPKLVLMTNVFGLYDHSEFYDLIDYDLFISKMILVRRMYADRYLKDNFASKRKVLPYPVDVKHINSFLPSVNQVKAFKRKNNLQDFFIVGRIGRVDNAKFDLITLDGFAEFAKKVSNARFLLVGATTEILLHAKSLDISDKLIVFDTTPDLDKLMWYYGAIDVFLAASKIGESFGMVIAEAMAAGVPVVTISTPDRDNAQIELVDNGQTGFVVERNKNKIANVLAFLYEDEKIREILGESAKRKVAKDYRADKIVRSLELLIYNHLNIPIEPREKSLILDYSQGMVNDYINRCSDLWEPEIRSES
ncbi:glycosyltransferase involved in cell wall biosynthesis [Pedobacter cryoconitis]|uniref:Glycosyltransferase involved in cell wall biosynthesis n=1 Tax=Pedobacter cryoconitis TaxID=188932 RepID=A0A7W8ZPZ9_9SPHI|nr:glycosyltransferase family 4 protein [Pedobacter cryoconitis]MBB5637802.1 glycosyltransferase involved in cell wall biosynthesis [Pedobacter cryoconitis]